MSKKCFIFGALEVNELKILPNENDLIIAADRGFLTVKKFNLKCDLLIGDFDSLGYIPDFDNTLVLPTHKDDTDIGYAINKAISSGCTEFYIYGAFGKREDMSYANIQLISSLSKRGFFAILFGDEFSVTAITNSKISFPEATGRISVFSVSERSYGVCEKGLEYELDNATLSVFHPLGVSNSFVGNKSEISVENGTLAVFFDSNTLPYPK